MTMSSRATLYPLLFEDLFKEKIWGGRRLETRLGRTLPPGQAIGESWEVSDRAPDVSVVANGPLRGVTLHQLVQERPDELLGPGFDLGRFRRFPLLVKLIDADRVLSVQVHPDDDFARNHDPHDDGKTEMLYVLDSQPDTVLYLGLKEGVTRSDLEGALARGDVSELLCPVEVARSDAVFVPPGTVHAYGAGLLVAEVQQNSDLTYRVYDWGRVGADGRPRPLHLKKALAVVNWEARPEKVKPALIAEGAVRRELLVRSPKFAVERWTLREAVSEPLRGRFLLLMALEGSAELAGAEGGPAVTLARGRSALLPAALERVEFRPQGETLLLVVSPGDGGG